MKSEKIYIFNTNTREKDEFKPVRDGEVRMYVCGPTVYDFIHIGNARPQIFFDVVRRYFEAVGYKVTYVQNITDIDDKIINKAIEENISSNEVAKKYTKALLEDQEYLGLKEPDHTPKATQYVGPMIRLIKKLEADGFAYNSDGNVFFEVGKDADYGSLSKKPLDQIEAGERVDENIKQQKKDPARDFALWKTAKPGEPSWGSPWGKGRPGWHTECVVMSTDLLGEEFDIHGGGIDLVFPHHENEIAQARCGTDAKFARYWMHNEFLNIRGEKMAKSLGNHVTVRDLRDSFSREAVRLFFLQTHYRKVMSFDTELLQGAESAVSRISRVMQKVENKIGKDVGSVSSHPEIDEFDKRITEAMADDFNTAKTIGEVFSLIGSMDEIAEKPEISEEERGFLLNGLNLIKSVDGYLKVIPAPEIKVDEAEVERLVKERNEHRANRNWSESDAIRDKLLAMNIMLEDTAEGTRWHIKR